MISLLFITIVALSGVHAGDNLDENKDWMYRFNPMVVDEEYDPWCPEKLLAEINNGVDFSSEEPEITEPVQPETESSNADGNAETTSPAGGWGLMQMFMEEAEPDCSEDSEDSEEEHTFKKDDKVRFINDPMTGFNEPKGLTILEVADDDMVKLENASRTKTFSVDRTEIEPHRERRNGMSLNSDEAKHVRLDLMGRKKYNKSREVRKEQLEERKRINNYLLFKAINEDQVFTTGAILDGEFEKRIREQNGLKLLESLSKPRSDNEAVEDNAKISSQQPPMRKFSMVSLSPAKFLPKMKRRSTKAANKSVQKLRPKGSPRSTPLSRGSKKAQATPFKNLINQLKTGAALKPSQKASREPAVSNALKPNVFWRVQA